MFSYSLAKASSFMKGVVCFRATHAIALELTQPQTQA